MKYGKLENGRLVIWNESSIEHKGKRYINPKKDILADYEIYPIEEIADDGNDIIVGGVIKHYVGRPIKASKQDEKDRNIRKQLKNTDSLIEAVERMVAAAGATEEDRAMAAERIALRDSIGKVIRTEEGDGTDMNPFVWTDGKVVKNGCWYKTPSGYIWEAIKSGKPSSETDTKYFDVVGL